MDVDAPIDGSRSEEGSRNGATAPLISVIVPIYNVAPWLRRCLDSLVHQSMKQIEVIMVDDGSTDESGRIAGKYVTASGVWPRFRMIHHGENKGLSAARNTGIEIAAADWIMFVDSDDWVESEFCRIPYETAVDNQVDMVIFLAYDVNKRGRVKKPSKNHTFSTGVVGFCTAIEYGWYAAWNKIYRKKLFDGIRYPEGRVYEDKAVTHKLVHRAKHIYFIGDRLYYYVDRKGSITNTLTRLNKRDSLISAIERYYELISYGYPAEKIKNSLCAPAIGYLGCTRDDSDELYRKALEIMDSIEGIPNGLSWKQTADMMAWKIDKRLFYLLRKVSGRL